MATQTPEGNLSDQSAIGDEPRHAASPFLHFPLEIRNMIYEFLIRDAIITRTAERNLNLSTRLWDRPLIKTPQFDINITTKKVSFPNLRLPSNLVYTNAQIYEEMSILIYSKTHHLKVSGDFLLGLTSTTAIFEILERRPWICDSTRSVTIDLKFNHILPLLGGNVAISDEIAEKFPWLCTRLRIAELSVQKFALGDRRRAKKPESWIQRMLCALGLGKQMVEELLSGLHLSQKAMSTEHNTLPDLARLFETFPMLEKIDIQTDHCVLLSLFPAPKETASSFLPLTHRGVEVNVLLHNWQIGAFCSMLYRNGVETGTIKFASHSYPVVDISYESLVGGALPLEKVVRYRFMDCLTPENNV